MTARAQTLLDYCDYLFDDWHQGKLFRWVISDGSGRIPKGEACVQMGKFLPDNVKAALADHWHELEPIVRRRLAA
jgi:hypothetical protein